MNLAEVITADCANGIGMRLSVFVSGCTNHCKSCFQPETWDFGYGTKYTIEIEDRIIEELKKPFYDGLTVLGGEPFEIENQEEVNALIGRARREAAEKTVWVYTGFEYEKDLSAGGIRYTKWTDSILDNIDVLVDGRFVEELMNIDLNFRGSSNQRIIDMKKTRECGKVVLHSLNN